jgi:hypothetical protein
MKVTLRDIILRDIIAVLLTGVWVNVSEFLRNEFLLKHFWTAHYQSLGLAFPSSPLNAAVWVIWGFLFSISLYVISRRFSIVQSTFIAWLMGFLLMWVVTWNLRVLPTEILVFAFPLTLIEVLGGVCICATVASAQRMDT